MGASTPFLSPDGKWIAFFADDKLRKVPRSGGAPIDVASTPSSETGAVWGTDDNLLYSLADSALYRVRSDGTAAVVIVAEPGSPARRHALGALRWPALLPDNARALVSTDSGIAVMDLSSGAVRIVFHGEDSGHLRVKVTSTGPARAADGSGEPGTRLEQARGVVAALGGRIIGDDPARGVEVLLPRR